MAAFPNPSSFDQRLTLQTLVHKENGAGGSNTEWKTVGKIWASVEPMTASQRYFAQKAEEVADYTIKTRYRADISVNGKQRLLKGTTVYQIHGVIDIGSQKRFLRIAAESGVAS